MTKTLLTFIAAVFLAVTIPSASAAFCNGDYTNRYPLTQADNFANPFLLNDTYGIDFGDGPQYIWCNGTSNYLCYADSTDYACYNDDTKMPTFIDEGNGTEYGVPETDLLIWWTGNTTEDKSIYNVGVTNQGCTRTNAGNPGYAYDCDESGTDWMEFADTKYYESINDVQAYSFCIWIYPNAWAAADFDYIVNNEEAADYPFVVVQRTDNNLYWVIRTDGGDENLVTATLPTIGAWNHLCGTLGGTDQKLFLNGKNIQNNTFDAGAMDAAWKEIYINCRMDAGDRCGDALYDTFMLWNRTLLDAEVIALYNNTKPDGYSVASATEADAGAPMWSGNLTSPTSPQGFPAASIDFNVTWTDTGDQVDTAWLVHNFTGTSQSEVMTNQTDVWMLTITNPPAGDYRFAFYANNTGGAGNNSATYTFTINKATILINLTLNGTEDNLSMTFMETINVTAWTNTTGVTPTLYRNSTAAANPLVYDPAYGLYNYTAILNHTNYTASPKTYWATVARAASGISLTSAPSWSISEDTEVTVACSANLAVTLLRDGVIVSNPYIATLEFDIYSFNCTVADSHNYTPSSVVNNLNVISGGFGCTNTDTYAFEANVTVPAGNTSIVLDFTGVLNDDLILANLGDVFPIVNTSPKAWVNTTYGDLIIINTTGYGGQTISIRFGNNVINNNWNTTGNTTDDLTYTTSQINAYMKLTFVDERTGVVQLPPNANHTLFIFCDGGISSHNITGDRMTVATFEIADEINIRVQYSVTEIYARNYVISAETESINVYLVDADLDQVVQILLSLQDATGDFNNALFKARKHIEGNLRTMTEHYFDAEDKVIIYLINGDKYTLYADNGVEERSIGYLYVDSVDLSKTLTIGEILTTNQTAGNLSFGFYNSSNVIVFALIDASGLTVSAEMWIYNESDDLIYYTNSTNRTAIEFTYAVTNTSHEHKVHVAIHHSTFGLNSIDLWALFFGPGFIFEHPLDMFIDADMIGTIPGAGGASFKDIAGAGAIIGVAFMFTATTGPIGGIIAALVAASLVFFGWYGISIALIAVALVLAIVNHMTDKRRAN